MNFYDTLDQLQRGNISDAEVLNEILNNTQKEPERIKMFVNIIEQFLRIKERDLPTLSTQFNAFLKRVFNENLTIENTKDFDLTHWQGLTIAICQKYGYKSMQDITTEPSNPNYPFSLIIYEQLEEHESVNSFDGYIKPSSKNRFVLKEIYNLRDILLKYIEPIQETDQSINNTPFKDLDTQKLFEYIVKYWGNKSASKWGYIWEYFCTQGNGRLTNKTEYEAYLREKYNWTTGKANYESCNSKKRYSELEDLTKQFLENLDLN